jgi:hypothetical protein
MEPERTPEGHGRRQRLWGMLPGVVSTCCCVLCGVVGFLYSIGSYTQICGISGQICGTRYLKYQSIYNTGSIPGKKQLFPEKKQQAQQIGFIFL